MQVEHVDNIKVPGTPHYGQPYLGIEHIPLGDEGPVKALSPEEAQAGWTLLQTSIEAPFESFLCLYDCMVCQLYSTRQEGLGPGEFKDMRLSEGCKGNLEVFYNGTWGNVCVNGMSEETASLVCRELNCGRTGNHLPLRLRGAERSCSGRLEVYHKAAWGSICDQWDIRDAEVVCRQLGCGKALRADGSAAFGAGEGVIWLNRVKCRGDEIHLWDCNYSLKNHTDCSHKEDAGVTCADPYMSPPTIPRTITSTSTITDVQKTSSPLQTESAAVLCTTPTVVLLVLGVLLFLALVLLSGLVYQNRVLRRVISKRRRKTLPEAVYEEINRRYINKRTHVSTRRGSVLSESQHSGYEDVDQEFVSEEMTENYDDVITTGLNPNITAMDTPENSDDIITAGQDVGGVNDVCDGGKRDPSDLLSCSHYSLEGLAVKGGAVLKPGIDAAA
ncbi:hypothetical protein P4O66_002298 [Electrophorus voltai]|uniref:SRCR domain-containing protein n=1 Tax=Electrophorus voltai TaxID=2609070 RepID=A0AAD9DR01_9TELE|nr:hypothetical protein P4O66_002298 [Electrophorus voltai]